MSTCPTCGNSCPPDPETGYDGDGFCSIECEEGTLIAEWQPIETAPDGKAVLTKIDDERGVRNEQKLVRQGRLWFFPDMHMYVYYAPTHWRSLQEGE